MTAITIESRAIRRALAGRQSKIEDLAAIGIRAIRLEHLQPMIPISTVLLCGLAGALNPGLAVGDIVVDDSSNAVPAETKLPRGKIYTSSGIIATPAAKAALFASTGADAVDMEQSIVRAWCDRRGLRLIGVRAISDTANETLDPAVLGFVDDLGKPRPLKIAGGLVCNPSLIPYLLRLNANTKIALDRLGDAVRLIVDAL